FWTDAYCIVSVGGAPLEIVKQYIQSQDAPKS
ncbi:transposase, partial [Chamaesiphon sp. OTE_8_metabat_110]